MKIENFLISCIRELKQPFYLCASGNSMFPEISAGDMLLVEPYTSKVLIAGDIIVYHKFADHLTVHRVMKIIKIGEKRFYCETKGDNNDIVDSYKVFNHEIIGVVKKAESDEDNGFN